MKIVSWNVNGLFGTLKNHPFSQDELENPDTICFQEIRTSEEPEIFAGFYHYWNHSKRKGYGGTALLSKKKPESVRNGFLFGMEDIEDEEGRVITSEYDSFFLVTVYVPNAKKGKSGSLRRQAFRMKWDSCLYDHIDALQQQKPVILCGDFNAVRNDLDYYEENIRESWALQGYASDELSSMENIMELGLKDAFRTLHPKEKSYTWWSNRLNKRDEDRGWRLDYFFISNSIFKKVKDIKHLSNVMGSDHCPIELEVSL